MEGYSFRHETAEKRFNWALYENLPQIEREAAFRLLNWALSSLPPPWDSGWKGIGRKPYDARALTVVTIWQEIEGDPERVYTHASIKTRSYIDFFRWFSLPNSRELEV